jgi:hypothetical protein
MANEVVDEQAVYLTTGNPLPSDMESVVNWLLNEPFVTAFTSACSGCHGVSLVRVTVCVCVREREGTCVAGPSVRWARASGCILTRAVLPPCSRLSSPCPPADVTKLQTERGVALIDIVRELHP